MTAAAAAVATQQDQQVLDQQELRPSRSSGPAGGGLVLAVEDAEEHQWRSWCWVKGEVITVSSKQDQRHQLAVRWSAAWERKWRDVTQEVKEVE